MHLLAPAVEEVVAIEQLAAGGLVAEADGGLLVARDPDDKLIAGRVGHDAERCEAEAAVRGGEVPRIAEVAEVGNAPEDVAAVAEPEDHARGRQFEANQILRILLQRIGLHNVGSDGPRVRPADSRRDLEEILHARAGVVADCRRSVEHADDVGCAGGCDGDVAHRVDEAAAFQLHPPEILPEADGGRVDQERAVGGGGQEPAAIDRVEPDHRGAEGGAEILERLRGEGVPPQTGMPEGGAAAAHRAADEIGGIVIGHRDVAGDE